jgi:hypothetical protein
LVPLAAGCGTGSVDRESYVRQNVSLLRSIPPPPSGTLTQEVSTPYTRYSDDEGDVIGYRTVRTYVVPGDLTVEQLRRFYGRRLASEWNPEPGATAPLEFGFRKEDAGLGVVLDGRKVVVYLDHKNYKSGF